MPLMPANLAEAKTPSLKDKAIGPGSSRNRLTGQGNSLSSRISRGDLNSPDKSRGSPGHRISGSKIRCHRQNRTSSNQAYNRGPSRKASRGSADRRASRDSTIRDSRASLSKGRPSRASLSKGKASMASRISPVIHSRARSNKDHSSSSGNKTAISVRVPSIMIRIRSAGLTVIASSKHSRHSSLPQGPERGGSRSRSRTSRTRTKTRRSSNPSLRN